MVVVSLTINEYQKRTCHKSLINFMTCGCIDNT